MAASSLLADLMRRERCAWARSWTAVRTSIAVACTSAVRARPWTLGRNDEAFEASVDEWVMRSFRGMAVAE